MCIVCMYLWQLARNSFSCMYVECGKWWEFILDRTLGRFISVLRYLNTASICAIMSTSTWFMMVCISIISSLIILARAYRVSLKLLPVIWIFFSFCRLLSCTLFIRTSSSPFNFFHPTYIRSAHRNIHT